MMSTKFLAITRLIGKHLLVALFAVALGMIVGRGIAIAESKTIFVPGAGNVGTGETTGNAYAGAKGRSNSTALLYYLRAHIKIWHTGPLLQKQHNAEWYNSYGNWTNTIKSSAYGDYAVTRHVFRYQSGYPNTGEGYTSQSGGWSCFNAWNTFSSPC
jgi:hypothetical protein